VKVIANIVPNLSGGIIIGSDVMKALHITIPYNEDNTATLRVAGSSLTFKYNTTARPGIPMIKKMIVVKKSERIPVSATESFNALFYGDRYHEGIGRPALDGQVRPIPKRLRKEVLREYEAASTDPKGYLQSFKSKDRPSAAQLVALHRVFTEYDVELSDNRPMSLMRRDGTSVQTNNINSSVQTNNINLISTDVTQNDVKPDRNLLKNLRTGAVTFSIRYISWKIILLMQ